MSFTMRMPRLCCKCGENPPALIHTVQEERVSISPWTFLTMFIGVGVTNRRRIFYQVPVCAECGEKLARRQSLGNYSLIAGVLLFVAGVVLMLSQTTALNSVEFLSSISWRFSINPRDFTAILLMILGVVVGVSGSRIGKARLAATNGDTFRFYNKAFHQAFAELNPYLVEEARSFWR